MKNIERITIFFLFIFIVLIVPGFEGCAYDKRCWLEWAGYIHDKGLQNVYDLDDNNYPPLYHYILFLYAQLAGNESGIHAHIAYLRAFTLVFDFAGIWYVYKWVGKTTYGVLLFFGILNIAYSYNTIVWGQVDGILAALLLMMMYYLSKDNLAGCAICLVLALNFKLQAIVLLPVTGLVFLDRFPAKPGWKKVALAAIAGIVTQALIVVPFIFGTRFSNLFRVITAGTVGKYPFLSMAAANFWYLVRSQSLGLHDDYTWKAGITYKLAGLVLFGFSSLLVLLPLLLTILKRHAGIRRARISKEMVFLAAALVYLLFFYFNTEMHERYAHPAFIFITAYAFSTGDFIGYALFSIAYFLNLEGSLQWMPIAHKTLFFDFRFVSLLYGCCIVYLGARLYVHWLNDQRLINHVPITG